jgi:hypothetical protein
MRKFRGSIGSAFAALPGSTLSSYAMGSGEAAGDWWGPLDHYCEGVGADFWAEPFNAITNGAFLVTAAVILVRQRREGWADKPVSVMALLTASVGFGSFLFHTLANGWSLIADILPIAVVIYACFFLAMRRFLNLNTVSAGLSAAALLALSPGLEALLKPLLGASAAYSPGLIATFGVAAAVPVLTGRPMPLCLAAAGAVFAAALVFRMLDAPLCDSWPIGTHFIWHMLNALALGLALQAAERAGRTIPVPATDSEPGALQPSARRVTG